MAAETRQQPDSHRAAITNAAIVTPPAIDQLAPVAISILLNSHFNLAAPR
jgi:hypothetical protein